MLVQQNDEAVSCFIEDFDIWNGGQRYEGAAFTERLIEFRKVPRKQVGGIYTMQRTIGMVQGQLKFVQILCQLPMKRLQASYIAQGMLDEVEAFVESEKALAPAGMQAILQSSDIDWVWLATSQGIVDGLFTGFGICFPAAFCVLLFATHNIIVVMFAMINIASVVAGVLGYCQFSGWTLGVTESIAAIIVIGLAVDYPIHMGHAYLEGGKNNLDDRDARWQFALQTMGTTVYAGAITTLGSAVAMQFCQITFFRQMSTLIVLTVSYSIFYTMYFFMALLKIVGPEGNTGDVGHMIKSCRSKLTNRKSESK
jgi:hypothetical protein